MLYGFVFVRWLCCSGSLCVRLHGSGFFDYGEEKCGQRCGDTCRRSSGLHYLGLTSLAL